MTGEPRAKIACPICDARDVIVVDCRGHKSGAIRRRRQCNKCGHRFTTFESTITATPPTAMQELWLLRTHAELLVEAIDRAMKVFSVPSSEKEPPQ